MLGFKTMLKTYPEVFAKPAHCKNFVPCLHFPAGAFFVNEKKPKMILPCVHIPAGAFFGREMLKDIMPCVHFPAGPSLEKKRFCKIAISKLLKIIKNANNI